LGTPLAVPRVGYTGMVEHAAGSARLAARDKGEEHDAKVTHNKHT